MIHAAQSLHKSVNSVTTSLCFRFRTGWSLLWLLSLVLALPLPAASMHIVGGHLTMRGIPGAQPKLRVSLRLYYDATSDQAQRLQQQLVAGIYRYNTNATLATVTLPLQAGSESLQPSSTNCQAQNTYPVRVFTYLAEVSMPSSLQNLPQDEVIYTSVVHTARNFSVVNLNSRSPQGVVYYAETRAGLITNNANQPAFPEWQTPPLPVACVGQLSTLRQSAVFPGADSVSYALVNALGGYIPLGSDVPQPGPYASAIYNLGYTGAAFLKSSTAITINRSTGAISATPQITGLHSYAVEASAWQRGSRVARSRIEIQALVYDCGPPAGMTVVTRYQGRVTNHTEGNEYRLSVDNTDGDCLELGLVATGQAGTLGWNWQVDPNPAMAGVSPTSRQVALRDTFWTSFCAPVCAAAVNQTYRYEIVASRSDCSPSSQLVRLVIAVGDLQPPDVSVYATAPLQTLADGPVAVPLQLAVSQPVPVSYTVRLAGRSVSHQLRWQPAAGNLSHVDTLRVVLGCEQLALLPPTVPLTVAVTANGRCLSGQDSSTVTLANPYALEELGRLPNIMTVNRDGKNDCWPNSMGEAVPCPTLFFDLTIYNRWGQPVYERRHTPWVDLCWNGDQLPAGVYFFALSQDNKLYKGVVNLLR